MKRRCRHPLAVAGLLLSSLSSAAVASTPSTAAAVPDTQVAGWQAFVESLRDLPEQMMAKLPEAQRNDPQTRAEIGRVALEALASTAIEAVGADPAHPVFLPSIGQLLNIGQPNADTSYRVARISPTGSYRLRGTLGTLRMFNISQSPPSPADPGFDPKLTAPRPRHDFKDLHVDAGDHYDVLLSPARPADYHGDWWRLEPTTTILLMRMVKSDWAKEREPTVSIERIDVPATRPRRTAADLEARLRQLPRAASHIAIFMRDRVEMLKREGYLNKLKDIDFSAVGGLTGQYYYEGAYKLNDDEALIVEAKVPAGCTYRSLLLTNYIYETTDWYNNHSSLNDTQAPADSDGVLRVVVSARDPGVANWLDTAGYPEGMIQGRWVDCASRPLPTVAKVTFAKLRGALPADVRTMTPPERERTVRERRAQLQRRPLW